MPIPMPEGPEFLRLAGGDEGADLAVVALEIARDANPGLDTCLAMARIEALADRVRPRIASTATVDDRLRQINWVLYVEEKFSGNEENYFDPANSDLAEVLERRTGIPISLGVLYRAIAGRLGLPMWGVNLPFHFVLGATRDDGSAVYLDPFHAGALLNRDDCRRLIASRAGKPVELAEADFLPCSNAEVVARMLRNLKAIHLQGGDQASAFPVLRRLMALEPKVPEHRRDLGVALLGLDRPADAVEQLSAYLEQAAQPGDSATIRRLILEARGSIGEGE